MAGKRVVIDRILCPTDFSDFSARALDRAVGLARWFGARVTAVHVIAPSSPAGILGSPTVSDFVMVPADLLRQQREAIVAELRAFVEPRLGRGVDIDPIVTDGVPYERISELAASLPADLLVMGTHGRTGFDRLVLGSTTERTLRRVACPVLTVGRDDAATGGPLFNRILCATDLGAGSEATVDLALSFAQEAMARLTLLHVVEGRGQNSAPEDLRRWAEIEGLNPRDVIDLALEQLHRLGQSARAFCTVEERVETGRAWREIVRVAAEVGADLVVAGAHVSGGFGRFFLGSTANQVVRHAPCPVLISRSVAVANASAVPDREHHAVGH
jgi:nucleotide-binding universal stress UspA family protein